MASGMPTHDSPLSRRSFLAAAAAPVLVDPFDNDAIARAAACFTPVLRIPGHYINDHCLIRDARGTFHVFYILGTVGGGPYTRGNEVIIGHATSPNLRRWQTQPHALEIPPGAAWWESAHIFAPYVIAHAGQYWML
jgi:hypothetical protein